MGEQTRVWDGIIAGAGIAGAALALGLKRAMGAAAAIMLCDPAFELDGAASGSLRAVAIAPDVRRQIEMFGLWTGIASNAQAITSMVITDGRAGLLPNPAFLHFGDDAARPEPLAHMVVVDELRRLLLQACNEAGVVFDSGAATGFRKDPAWLTLTLGDGRRHRTRLLAAADGGRSRLRHAAGIQTLDMPYPQSAIVATLSHSEDHQGRATQHFLPGGPIALLPMRAADGSRHRTSLVWTDDSREAARLVALPAPLFCAALQDRIGFGLGTITLEDRPSAHALRLSLARRLTGPRFALLGDAARVIHPLAGQGLNLGLRDAAALTRRVADSAGLGLDPGASAVLAAYERDRRPDATVMAAGTDLLDRLFSNDSVALRSLRDLGLGAVDRMPALKRAFTRWAGADAAP